MNLGQLTAAYRLLALDGCDGTGKTTLAHRLSGAHGYQVIHSTRTPDNIDLAARYRRILATPGRLVLDRCFVSELVYGPLHRSRSRLSWDDTVDLAATLAAQGGALIHLTGRPAAIHARLLARRDTDVATVADISKLVTTYQRVFAALTGHAPVIHLDTTQPPTPIK